MTAHDHNKLLSIFYFVMAGLQILGGGLMAVIYFVLGGAMMSTSSRNDEQIMGGVFMGIGLMVGLFVAVLGGLTLLTGFLVHKQKPAGRTMGIIISILSLLSFPLGTALGVYGLWFFFGDLGQRLYSGMGDRYQPPPPPPSPHSWQ